MIAHDGDAGISSLYQQLIIEHYKSPKNRGRLEQPDVEVTLSNPTCGDEVTLQLNLTGNAVTDVRFEGLGCSISQASLSMMTQLVKGKSIEQIDALANRFSEMLHGDESAARDKQLGDLRALAGVSRYPVRVRCALLGWDALSQALRKAIEANSDRERSA